VRGGRAPKVKRMQVYVGKSYFDYLASLPDLVLLMDESHRYRASAGVRAINELKPIMGLELTATPFVETTAAQLLELIQSIKFFNGRYQDKVIQVDSSKTGKDEDEMIERLLKVEDTDEPTEIVIHVNMLKEGWDVTNLYTIVPLRAANARILIEQSIGRGLRLPYGRRTGVTVVDRLNIVAHDKFQEVVDAANDSESPIRMTQLILSGDELEDTPVTFVAQSGLASQLGINAPIPTQSMIIAPPRITTPSFATAAEQQVAQVTYQVIRRLENNPKIVPSVSYLNRPEVMQMVAEEVAVHLKPIQANLPGIESEADIASIVARTSQLVIDQTIDMSRILIVPTSEVRSGYHDFELDLGSLSYQAPSEELWVQHLRTHQREVLAVGQGDIEEAKLEDYVVSGLIDFDDISYDDRADLLYELAKKVVEHFATYLGDADLRKVLRCYQRPIANLVHLQMHEAFWEKAAGYEVKVNKGFTQVKDCAFTGSSADGIRDFRHAPADKSNMAKYLFWRLRAMFVSSA